MKNCKNIEAWKFEQPKNKRNVITPYRAGDAALWGIDRKNVRKLQTARNENWKLFNIKNMLEKLGQTENDCEEFAAILQISFFVVLKLFVALTLSIGFQI